MKAVPMRRGPKVGRHDRILGVFKTSVPNNHKVITVREVGGKTRTVTITYV
jgi:hypothetical protein